MRKGFIVVAVILLILVATSIQSLAEENLIYACFGENGKVTIVNDPNECKEKETAIYWNKVGPQGEQGPPGECDCPITQEQLDDLIARIEYLESFHPEHDMGFTDMGDGTVRDNDTGLIWLKDASCPDLAGTDPDGMADWETATAAAAALSGDGTCGLTDLSEAGDWRLPTRVEWEAFMSPVYEFPALVNAAGDAQWSEGDAFTGVQSTVYWSSTPYSSDTVWAAEMGGGFVREAYKDPGGSGFYVWPVRDAK
jgi:hypothetical protein